MAVAPKVAMTFAEYVARERDSEVKHQFFEGEMFAMAGGTPEHTFLAAAMIRELGVRLKGSPCRVFAGDLRVRVPADGLTTYPDASVVCGKSEKDPEDPSTVVNPSVIVEVLSDSTEAYDRGKKFSSYQKLASLGDYLLISQGQSRIEHYHRQPDGSWTYRALGPGQHFELLGHTFSVDEIYLGVEAEREPPVASEGQE